MKNEIYEKLYSSDGVYSKGKMHAQTGWTYKLPFILAAYELIKPTSFVELGAGQGFYARQMLSKRDAKYLLIERSEVCVAQYLQNLNVLNCSIQEYIPNMEACDLVFSTDVLEHLPKEEINGIIRALSRKAKYSLLGIANHSDIQDGVELHSIIENKDWWKRTLLESYQNVELVCVLSKGSYFLFLCHNNGLSKRQIAVFEVYKKILMVRHFLSKLGSRFKRCLRLV